MGHPPLELKAKTVVVIGGTSGIGWVPSRGLARAGANAVPTGRREAQVRAAVSAVEAREAGRSLRPATSPTIPTSRTFSNWNSLRRFVSVAASPIGPRRRDHGFVPTLIGIAREKGISAYVGDGLNRWSAVHRLDAAHLYRLVLEKRSAGARYHGVADEGVATREITEAIGRHLNLPVVSKSREEAADHFGQIALFFGMDGPASSAQTQEPLGWRPVQRGLIADLNAAHYFEHTAHAVPLHG